MAKELGNIGPDAVVDRLNAVTRQEMENRSKQQQFVANMIMQQQQQSAQAQAAAAQEKAKRREMEFQQEFQNQLEKYKTGANIDAAKQKLIDDKEMAKYKRPTLIGVDQTSGKTQTLAVGGEGGDYQNVLLSKPVKAGEDKAQVAERAVGGILSAMASAHDLNTLSDNKNITIGKSAVGRSLISNIVGKAAGPEASAITSSNLRTKEDESYQAIQAALRSNMNNAVGGAGVGTRRALEETLKMVPESYEDPLTKKKNISEINKKLQTALGSYTIATIEKMANNDPALIIRKKNKEDKGTLYKIVPFKNKEGKSVKGLVPLYDLNRNINVTEDDTTVAAQEPTVKE